MGASFPFLQRAVHADLDRLGRRVGWLQGANIAGSTLGAGLTGLVLLQVLGTAGTLRLIVAPVACHVLPEFQEGHRLWGLAVQLYSLRSARNWGAGDFGDLNTLVEWAAKDLHAGLIGLNPLHVLNNTRPFEISPYSPTSRLFLNSLYLDIEAIPEYQLCEPAQQTVQDAPVSQSEHRARAGSPALLELDEAAGVGRGRPEVILPEARLAQLLQQPGDQYVVFKIVLPPADTERARALYEQMKREMPFDPRAELS